MLSTRTHNKCEDPLEATQSSDMLVLKANELSKLSHTI